MRKTHLYTCALLLALAGRGDGQTRIDLRTQSKGTDILGHIENTASPHTAEGIRAEAKQGSGSKFQMFAGSATQTGGIAVYDTSGALVAADCTITGAALSCGEGQQISTVVLPELSMNGTSAFVIHGAPEQNGDGCIVLAGQPAPGQVLRATGTTMMDDDWRTCVMMEWTAQPPVSDLSQIATRRYADLQEIPAAFTPAAHAASHQHGGTDEVGSAIPAPHTVVKAGGLGMIAGGWLPAPNETEKGGVVAKDCGAAGQFVQSINSDASITCGTPPGGGGTGGVMSVGLSMPRGFAVTGSPVTGSGILTAGYAPLGSAYVLQEEFISNTTTAGIIFGTAGGYGLQNINGTNGWAYVGTDSGAVGVIELRSGATTGNDALFNIAWHPGSGSAPFPPMSETTSGYAWETRVRLVDLTNNTAGAGLLRASNGTPLTGQGLSFHVTNSGTPGTWQCRISNASSNTTFDSGVAATTNWTTLKIAVVSSTQVEYYINGTKVGCFSVGGVDGCMAVTEGYIPVYKLGPAWQSKTNEDAAKALQLDAWRFIQ